MNRGEGRIMNQITDTQSPVLARNPKFMGNRLKRSRLRILTNGRLSLWEALTASYVFWAWLAILSKSRMLLAIIYWLSKHLVLSKPFSKCLFERDFASAMKFFKTVSWSFKTNMMVLISSWISFTTMSNCVSLSIFRNWSKSFAQAALSFVCQFLLLPLSFLERSRKVSNNCFSLSACDT